ncbi:putative MATE family efflux protein [Bacilli bacterium PM5-3]|nr:putative MATE family efflux protein [Bacilli bacterium PM5-3]MDH6604030.1 putative MATE family efflux protein [Bacilli bacterium PM5-9]
MEGNILNKFFKYTSFNILSMIGMSAYILADTLFIANRLGVNGLASLNIAIPIFSLIMGTGLMIGMGGATAFSFSNNKKEKNKFFSQSIYIAAILSIIFVIVGLFFSKPLASLLGSNIEILDMTNTYLKTLLIFAPAFIFENLFLCFIRNDNSPRLAMIAMLIASFCNIILDYIFMYPIPMGIFGAALATCLAPIIALCIMTSHFINKKNTFKFIKIKQSFSRINKIFLLGSSFLINEISSGIVILAFNLVILNISGNIGVAAYGIIANLAVILVSIYNGLAQGIQPITSEEYGNNNYVNLKKIFKYTLLLAYGIAIVSYLFIFFFNEPLIQLFNSDPQLVKIATKGLLTYFIAFFFIALNIPMVSYLNSLDKPKHAFIISIARGLVITLPVLLLLSSLFKMNGVWTSIIVAEFLTALITIYFIKKDIAF